MSITGPQDARSVGWNVSPATRVDGSGVRNRAYAHQGGQNDADDLRHRHSFSAWARRAYDLYFSDGVQQARVALKRASKEVSRAVVRGGVELVRLYSSHGSIRSFGEDSLPRVVRSPSSSGSDSRWSQTAYRVSLSRPMDLVQRLRQDAGGDWLKVQKELDYAAEEGIQPPGVIASARRLVDKMSDLS
ncbi:MAG: hypothetical protein HQL54_10330 [Magnetococcales bacterium]|nr:hypothetical protein [Magnetococcales bacterium]